ncbi:13586_t:CDS:2 [Racocetra fulgida]|uniref:13586_t:CDS:1 n=1 Tax=Racocetra fulgida TaxID=60492 RepID=A0A9N9BG28_9GLOM|nr:13586_t:CDS:2 [Racocetra fulgida]
MPRSLNSHISNLEAESCKEERFSITKEHGPKGSDDLVFHKASFPYDWFNTSEKIDATSLLPIEAFDSILNKSKYSEKESFDIIIFRDYYNFYLNLDILLLADCLEGFRKLMKSKFGLDIAHYVSLLSFAEDALYKTTEQEIKLFIDDNMYLFCKKGIQEGISMISDNAEKDYILEVDLDYPYKLHKAHTSYPLASENIKISKEEISKREQKIINDLKYYTKTKKLISNLNNKKKYIVHYRALQFYIKQEMVLIKFTKL